MTADLSTWWVLTELSILAAIIGALVAVAAILWDARKSGPRR